MSFEKIHLPDQLLADLYKDGLVVIDKEITVSKNNNKPTPVTPQETAAPVEQIAKMTVHGSSKKKAGEPLSFLGNNQKNISIIVNDSEAIHLQDELLEILSAILNACKLNLADVAILNMYGQEVLQENLKRELHPSSVLLFGINTSEIGLPFTISDYKIQPFDGCAYLQAASLEKMKGISTDAKLEKSKLWVCLKTLFSV